MCSTHVHSTCQNMPFWNSVCTVCW